ncbi:MAG: hypothetical protein UY91_C0021G0004 [Parcubacteria group bacterium GW2011_GWB1_55_9]|nr:MAG: hypothetical protein UY91_C0021G0004 [Parcubacteria group bacterium GW2011_GWB1_55_9]
MSRISKEVMKRQNRERVVSMIKTAMDRMKMSQNELAHQAKMDPGHLSRLLKGETAVREEGLKRIAHVLGLELIEFLGAAGYTEIDDSASESPFADVERLLRALSSFGVTKKHIESVSSDGQRAKALARVIMHLAEKPTSVVIQVISS